MFTANIRVNLSFILALVLGFFIGWEIAFFKEFKFYKLVNITGLFYDLIAVILLSYTFFLKDNIKSKIAHNIALVFIIFSGMLPVAITGGMYLANFFGGAHIESLKSFIYTFVVISIIPATKIFSSPVLEPVGRNVYQPTFRLQILGGVLLFMGFAFQIVAAFADFLENA